MKIYLTEKQEAEYKNITAALRKVGAKELATKRDGVTIARLRTVPQIWDLIAVMYQGKRTKTTRTMRKLSWDEAKKLSLLVVSGMVPKQVHLSEVLELVGFYDNTTRRIKCR